MSDMTTEAPSESIFHQYATLDTVSRAAKEGAADAREMADRVWASTSLFLSRFVYTTSYTLAYGVVFPATLISRAVPRDNAAVRGLMDGARAASDKVHEMRGPDPIGTTALTVHSIEPG